MNKFNLIYENILDNFKKMNFSSKINPLSYDFKYDDENNLLCSFVLQFNEEKFFILAKYFQDELSFVVTDNFGNSKTYTEKEFAASYYKDYEQFKESLNNFIKSNPIQDQNDDSLINSLTDEIEDQENFDINIKFSKNITINNKTFIFKLLNDIAVDTYCESIFDIYDTKLKETFYFKVLLSIKPKNSLIIKMIKLNEHGQMIEKMTKSDFKKKYKSDYLLFDQAIDEFEDYINDNRFFIN